MFLFNIFLYFNFIIFIKNCLAAISGFTLQSSAIHRYAAIVILSYVIVLCVYCILVYVIDCLFWSLLRARFRSLAVQSEVTYTYANAHNKLIRHADLILCIFTYISVRTYVYMCGNLHYMWLCFLPWLTALYIMCPLHLCLVVVALQIAT